MRNTARAQSPGTATKRSGLHPALEKKVKVLGMRISAIQHKMATATPEQKFEKLGRLHGLEQRHQHLEEQLRALDRGGPGFRQDVKAKLILFADDLMGALADLTLSVDEHDDAQRRPIKRMHESPLSFYEELVEMGGGLMQGKFMLQGWKNMHPEQHYIQDHIDLYEHIDDPAYLAKEEVFESWYENPIDLPGRWYLQAIKQLFMDNRLAKGKFVRLGRTLNLRDIKCPVYLLAGAADDITTPEQVLDAVKYLGTPKDHIVQKTVPGGHIGLFMGARTLKEHWPPIAQWIAAQ